MTITDPQRTTPSPAAVALAIQCRKAKTLADTAPTRFQRMPAPATTTAAGGEVQLVVRPKSLTDWARWTNALGIRDTRRMTHTGANTVCRFELDGVRARLIGVGVPALLAAAYGPKGTARV
ncbi:hypothetical protein ACIRJ3_03830 [Streptomyces anulatus]